MANFRHVIETIYNIFPYTTSILTLYQADTFVNVYMAYLRIHFYHFTTNETNVTLQPAINAANTKMAEYGVEDGYQINQTNNCILHKINYVINSLLLPY